MQWGRKISMGHNSGYGVTPKYGGLLYGKKKFCRVETCMGTLWVGLYRYMMCFCSFRLTESLTEWPKRCNNESWKMIHGKA